jgi:hypothetical protein
MAPIATLTRVSARPVFSARQSRLELLTLKYFMMKRPESEGGSLTGVRREFKVRLENLFKTVSFEGRWLSVGRDDEAKPIVRH